MRIASKQNLMIFIIINFLMPIINHYCYYAYRVPANNQLRKQSSKFFNGKKTKGKLREFNVETVVYANN